MVSNRNHAILSKFEVGGGGGGGGGKNCPNHTRSFAELLLYANNKISTEFDKNWSQNKNFYMQMRVGGA